MLIGLIILSITAIIGIIYIKKTVDLTTSIIYGIYAFLIIFAWFLFYLSYSKLI